MKKTKISVIVPCYNVEKYITRCLNSLINQTLKDIEIICIDDKSLDKTKNIIKKYAKKDKRIKLIELKQNSGAAVARNAGLNIAIGKYIGFVDPDDYVDLDFYEKLYIKTINNQYDVAIGNVAINRQGTNEIYNKNFQSQIKKKGIIAFENCFWTGIYKHSFLKKYKIRFPDEIRYSQDSVFLTQVSLFAKNIFCIDNIFYHYFYQRPDSLDSEFLSHDKAESKYNAFKMNLNYINNIEFNNISKKHEYILNHVLNYVNYEIQKKYEDDNDRKKMFSLLHILATEYLPEKYFKSNLYKHIKSNNYKNYIKLLNYQCIKRYIFRIPVLYSYKYEQETNVKLFKIIPLLKIKDNKLYLFNFLPIYKNNIRIVRITGGIGNQMFQYAFGLVLGNDTKYDISWFDEIKGNFDITQREYELNFWKINPIITKKTTKKLKHTIESPFNIYNPKLLKEKNCVIEGYFQVAQYYESVRKKLLKDFIPRNKPDYKNQKILDLINNTNAVSIHVRRGDYVNLQHVHGLCGLDYYKKAINFISKKIKNPHFFIFSDDIMWVKENLETDFPCEFIDFNHGHNSAWDIWLMANCKHNIIANSSFSWWGAWLNQNPDKIVIAPKHWKADGSKTDIVPTDWKRI